MIAQCNVRYADTCAIDVRARTHASIPVRAIDLQAIVLHNGAMITVQTSARGMCSQEL